MSVFHIPETKFQAEEATDSRPKPFLKWVGGKGQLLHQFDRLFPRTFHHYYEPFVGSGVNLIIRCRRTGIWANGE